MQGPASRLVSLFLNTGQAICCIVDNNAEKLTLAFLKLFLSGAYKSVKL